MYLLFKAVKRGTINGALGEGVPKSYCIWEEAPLVDKCSRKGNEDLLRMTSMQGCGWSDEGRWDVNE